MQLAPQHTPRGVFLRDTGKLSLRALPWIYCASWTVNAPLALSLLLTLGKRARRLEKRWAARDAAPASFSLPCYRAQERRRRGPGQV